MVVVDLLQHWGEGAPKNVGYPHSPPHVESFRRRREGQIRRYWEDKVVEQMIAMMGSEPIGQIGSALHQAVNKK